MEYFCPKWFSPKEFVPPSVYRDLGDRCLLVMRYNILKTAESLRSYFNKAMVINDWAWKGKRKYSGFRPARCRVGAKYSQHKFGAALDFNIQGMLPEEVRQAILANSRHFPYITAMELHTPTWVHVDARACVGNGIELFSP